LALSERLEIHFRHRQPFSAAARVRGNPIIGVDQPFLSPIEFHPATAAPPRRLNEHRGIGLAPPHRVDLKLNQNEIAEQSGFSLRVVAIVYGNDPTGKYLLSVGKRFGRSAYISARAGANFANEKEEANDSEQQR
jgi:hypothetical protein